MGFLVKSVDNYIIRDVLCTFIASEHVDHLTLV